ncbi:MAG TPA: ABC transporter permease [Vicinamibacterales bacterium]|nr:ABC transporter permease [Vicinamibacterales bacterium]
MPQHLRAAIRRVAAEPGFALVIVVAIGLGIGMNTTVFTLVNAVLLRGLPYDHPDEVVVVSTYDNQRRDDSQTSWPDYQDWMHATQSFVGMAAMTGESMNVSGGPGAPERISGQRITTNAFGLLGQPMALGRDFVEADGRPGAPPVMILGYGIWERSFASDPAVIGRTIRVNDMPTEIVGVMSRGVRFPQTSDAWIPLQPGEDRDKRDARNFEVFGRLKRSVGTAEAQAELAGIAARLERTYPTTNEHVGVLVQTFNQRQNGGPIRVVFLMLLAAVSLLLLIACANVANLLIARAISRQREIAVRIALGAGRRTIVAQLLTESVLLGCLGGLLGLALAYIGVTLFDRATADVGKPYWILFQFDWHVFAWLALACVGTGLIFGLAPAVQLARTDTNVVLKDGGRGTTTSRGRWLVSSLVIVEMAFTLALLAGAGVMIRSFLSLYQADLGARVDNVLTGSVTLPERKYPTPAERQVFRDRLGDRLRALPGVEAASISTTVPGSGIGTLTLDIEGERRATKTEPREVRVASVGAGFFETFGIHAIAGRVLERRDGHTGSEGVVVNQRFVDKFLGGRDALGRRIMLRPDDKDTPWASIVGVVPHVRHNDTAREELDAVVYRPFELSSSESFIVALRSHQPTTTLAAALRETVQQLDPDLPIAQIRTMEDMLARMRWPFRVFGSLFVLFALFGLVLSTIGMYAVTAYSVGERQAEIGVRMALGAQQTQVAWLVLRRGIVQLAIGVPLGLALAYVVTIGMKSLLIGINPGDPLTLGSTAVIVVCITLAACLVPARRAARLNPVAALRN